MIKSRKLVLFGLLLLVLTASTALAAGPYDIPWWTVDGGGGSSAGTTYALRGTLGQPDAGPRLTGTTFALVGGFWGVGSEVPVLYTIYLPIVLRGDG